jgi:hypothetical protein
MAAEIIKALDRDGLEVKVWSAETVAHESAAQRKRKNHS